MRKSINIKMPKVKMPKVGRIGIPKNPRVFGKKKNVNLIIQNLKMRTKVKDRIGQRFTMLTIIGVAPPEYRASTVMVRCDCGVEKYIHISNLLALKGGTKSCGCKKVLDYKERNSGVDDCVKDGRSISKRKYQCYHARIKNKYGKANKCEHCNTKDAKRYEYALKKGREYSDNIDDYIQMCCSCHKKYDLNDETRKKISKSQSLVIRKWQWRPVVQLSKEGVVIKEHESVLLASVDTGTDRVNLHRVLSGERQSAGGYLWNYL